MSNVPNTGPLQGMKVIELAHIMAGPVAGLMLADMGADVIKVERPSGDDTRRFLPPDINGESAAFMMMMRLLLRLRWLRPAVSWKASSIPSMRFCWRCSEWRRGLREKQSG